MPLQRGQFSILDYDDNPEAIIQPDKILPKLDNMPERVVMCFFLEVIEKFCADAPVIVTTGSEHGKFPVYRFENDFGDVAVMHPGVGAPLGVAFIEEAIAWGGRKFIACGSCGVLVKHVAEGQIVLPDSAVRDEGASYHYLPADVEVKAHPAALDAMRKTVEKHNLPYEIGKTWTTDAIYRETKARMEARVAEGCLTVEMEAAAFMAVAQFRDVMFGQLLYGGDDLAGDAHDHRDYLSNLSCA